MPLRRGKPLLPEGPLGRLCAATLLAYVGAGAWYVCWAIYATRSLGLTPTGFGLGLTVAGVLGMLLGGPIGYAADRIGVRETLVGLTVVQGTAALCYLFVTGFTGFLLVTCVAVAAERAVPGVRAALVAALQPSDERLRGISATVVAGHVGAAAGAAAGALVLYLDSRTAYAALILLYGSTLLGFALIVSRVPRAAPPGERRSRREPLVLRDRTFLALTALSGILALNWGMVGSGLPLWLTEHTSAPAWIMGVLIVLNAVTIALFQNRVSRRGGDARGAARLSVWCAVALTASCLLFAATYHGSGPWVVALLLAAAAAHVLGEMLFVAGTWGLSVALAPDDAQGEYQGTFGAGLATAQMAAPALMAVLVVEWGVGGWFVLCALFLGGGLPMTVIGRRAGHRRPTARTAPRPHPTDSTRQGGDLD